MRPAVRLSFSVVLALAVAGCNGNSSRPDTPVRVLTQQPGGVTQPQPGPLNANTQPPPTVTDATPPPPVPGPTPDPSPVPAPAPQPPAKSKFPFGQTVAGKPGFCTSPYAPLNGLVDVRDPGTGNPLPRGTLVKCPFTSKPFFVP